MALLLCGPNKLQKQRHNTSKQEHYCTLQQPPKQQDRPFARGKSATTTQSGQPTPFVVFSPSFQSISTYVLLSSGALFFFSPQRAMEVAFNTPPVRFEMHSLSHTLSIPPLQIVWGKCSKSEMEDKGPTRTGLVVDG